MNEQLKDFITKKNILSLLSLGIIILAIPLGINLIQQQQIFKSRATAATLTFVEPNVETRTAPNGSPVTVATEPRVGIQIQPPEGWSFTATPGPSETPTPTPTPTGSGSPTPTPTATPSPTPAALSVDLKVEDNGVDKDFVSYKSSNATVRRTYKLKWTTTGNPTQCKASRYDNYNVSPYNDDKWGAQGTRVNPSGGEFSMTLHYYIYYTFTIECQNNSGSVGDTVSVQLFRTGVEFKGNNPTFDRFEVQDMNNRWVDGETPISLTKRTNDPNATFRWNTSVTGDHAICIYYGFYRVGKAASPDDAGEAVQLTQQDSGKSQQFTVYCSNENGFIKKTATINVQ